MSYEVMRKVNPNLIYVSVSGFGGSGPLVEEPVYDPIIQARASYVATQQRVGDDVSAHPRRTSKVPFVAKLNEKIKIEMKHENEK